MDWFDNLERVQELFLLKHTQIKCCGGKKNAECSVLLLLGNRLKVTFWIIPKLGGNQKRWGNTLTSQKICNCGSLWSAICYLYVNEGSAATTLCTMNLTLVKDCCHFVAIRIGEYFIYAQLLQLSAKWNAAFWLIEVSEHTKRLLLYNIFDFSMFQLQSLDSKPLFCEAGSLLSIYLCNHVTQKRKLPHNTGNLSPWLFFTAGRPHLAPMSIGHAL